MYLRIKINGNNINNLSKDAFCKMPGKLYVSNERKVDKIDKIKNNIKYFKDKDNNIIKKKLTDIETFLIYNKHEQNELEVIIFSITNTITYSKDYFGYVNEKEFLVNTMFTDEIYNNLRNCFKDETKLLNIEYEFGPIKPKMNIEQYKNMFEQLNFIFDYTEDKINLNFNFKDCGIYTIKVNKENTTLKESLSQLLCLIETADNYRNYKMTEEKANKIKRLTESWIENYQYKDLVIKRMMNYSNFANEYINELKEEEIKEKEKNGFGKDGEKLHDTLIKEIYNKLDFNKDKFIIDYGCNRAVLTKYIYKQLKKENKLDEFITIINCDSNLQVINDNNATMFYMNKNTFKTKSIMSSLYFEDHRLDKADVLILCEVIEHNDKEKLNDIMNNLLSLKCKKYIISTPNRDFNKYIFLKDKPEDISEEEWLKDKSFRHWDHRFEFNTLEFKEFFDQYKDKYKIEYFNIGEEIDNIYPTNMVIIEDINWNKDNEIMLQNEELLLKNNMYNNILYNSDKYKKIKYERNNLIYKEKLQRYKEYIQDPEKYINKKQEEYEKYIKEKNRINEEAKSKMIINKNETLFIDDFEEIIQEKENTSKKQTINFIPKKPFKEVKDDKFINGYRGNALFIKR